MLARYRIVRGKRSPRDPLPSGIRIDVRKHRSHVLSPDAASVAGFLADASPAGFARFSADYERLLRKRFRERREEFDALARAAQGGDVYVGCNCPTKKNPDVMHCHTVLALAFMKEKYPKLRVVFPEHG